MGLSDANLTIQGGSSVAAGDVNDDGADDLIMGLHPANSEASQTWVLFGPLGLPGDPTLLDVLADSNVTVNGDSAELSGRDVEGGDVNSDGIDDLVIGAIDSSTKPGSVSPNPPKDTDGRREDSGRVGEGATGEMAGLHWGRLEVGGRSSVAA